MNWSCEDIDKFQSFLAQAITSLSQGLDIAGLSEIKFLDNIQTYSVGRLQKINISGEMIAISIIPPKYNIHLSSSILSKQVLNSKEEVTDFINTLKHELCHVHDHNKISHIYEILNNNIGSIDFEDVSLRFASKIWSEFIATYLSSDTSSIPIIECKINALNIMYKDLETCESKKSTELLAQVLCCMAYVIGDILNKDRLAEKLNVKISVLSFPIFKKLFNEFDSLLESYPNWDDLTVFENLKMIFQSFYWQCKGR